MGKEVKIIFVFTKILLYSIISSDEQSNVSHWYTFDTFSPKKKDEYRIFCKISGLKNIK